MMHLLIFLIFTSLSESYAGGKFMKIENCTTKNKSLNIGVCKIVDDALSVSVDVFRPIDKIFVSYSSFSRYILNKL
jgi:hypothetical protein